MTIATQIVRKIKRPAKVCSRLTRTRAVSAAASFGCINACGAGGDALEIKVVIPHRAKDRTDWILIARPAAKPDRDAFHLRLGFEFNGDLLPFVSSGWNWR